MDLFGTSRGITVWDKLWLTIGKSKFRDGLAFIGEKEDDWMGCMEDQGVNGF